MSFTLSTKHVLTILHKSVGRKGLTPNQLSNELSSSSKAIQYYIRQLKKYNFLFTDKHGYLVKNGAIPEDDDLLAAAIKEMERGELTPYAIVPPVVSSLKKVEIPARDIQVPPSPLPSVTKVERPVLNQPAPKMEATDVGFYGEDITIPEEESCPDFEPKKPSVAPTPSKRTRLNYTPELLKEFCELFVVHGMSVSAVAHKLGRSASAVDMKLRTLLNQGVLKKVRTCNPTTGLLLITYAYGPAYPFSRREPIHQPQEKPTFAQPERVQQATPKLANIQDPSRPILSLSDVYLATKDISPEKTVLDEIRVALNRFGRDNCSRTLLDLVREQIDRNYPADIAPALKSVLNKIILG